MEKTLFDKEKPVSYCCYRNCNNCDWLIECRAFNVKLLDAGDHATHKLTVLNTFRCRIS